MENNFTDECEATIRFLYINYLHYTNLRSEENRPRQSPFSHFLNPPLQIIKEYV